MIIRSKEAFLFPVLNSGLLVLFIVTIHLAGSFPMYGFLVSLRFSLKFGWRNVSKGCGKCL